MELNLFSFNIDFTMYVDSNLGYFVYYSIDIC